MSIQTINPSNGEIIATYETMSATDVNTIIEQTQVAYLEWSQQTLQQRSASILLLSELLLDEKQQYAELMAIEMGKPITAGIAEVEKCAKLCRYYASKATDFLQPRLVSTAHQKSYVCYQALGIILAIMPWNFPLWQVFRFAVPNLILGNACLLKHAPISTGTALIIEKIIRQAGFTKHIFRTLVITETQVKGIIENHHVKGVTLTGSERAGKAVAAIAGSVIKKTVMEMGGSDPYIILEDANLEQAAKTCVTSRILNSGQVCIAAKRLIVVNSRYDRFVQLIINELEQIIIGDPLDSNTTIGPLARADLRLKLHQQVQKSIAQGAKLVLGGILPTGKGFYYPPTLLLNVKPGMPAYDEELFGPVVCVLRADDQAHAITLANDTRFGLGAAVFTADLIKGEKIARDHLQAGNCCVNSMVTSDPRLPFGGIKQSGYGRELAAEGLYEFANIKTVVIN